MTRGKLLAMLVLIVIVMTVMIVRRLMMMLLRILIPVLLHLSMRKVMTILTAPLVTSKRRIFKRGNISKITLFK